MKRNTLLIFNEAKRLLTPSASNLANDQGYASLLFDVYKIYALITTSYEERESVDVKVWHWPEVTHREITCIFEKFVR